MDLKDLGYKENIDQYKKEQNLSSFEVGRVISEHKERYILKSPTEEFEAELIGKLRFTAENRYDFPAVGDWVAFSEYDKGKALIHAIYPRFSIIERKAVSKLGQIQIIATNVDYGLIVQSVDRDFNLNRIERLLTICNASKVKPVIILSKIDLITHFELETIVQQINQRIKNVPIISISNETKEFGELGKLIKKGMTYCLLGSSGVGKSTLINNLLGEQQMKTGQISSSVKKGKHTTSHRELLLLDNGGILIDNPGMREVGIADTTDGLELTFDEIMEFSKNCLFKDCSHIHEKGCAILDALEKRLLDADAYANFQKMEKEKSFFEMNSQERRKKERAMGKLYKRIIKRKKKDKF